MNDTKEQRCDGIVDMYNYNSIQPLYDQDLVACNRTDGIPLMFPDEMFCLENSAWSSLVIANICFAAFGIALLVFLIFMSFGALSDGCRVLCNAM